MARLASLVNALPVVLNILAGLFLWFDADTLARCMVKDADRTIQPLVVGQEAQMVAFSAPGLFTLLQVIPHIGRMAANFYVISHQDALMRRDFTGLAAPDVVGVVIQLSLGLWLLLGASGLVKLLQSFRTVGMDKQNRATIDTP